MNKYVALSFDDGPNNVVTPMVLDRLEKYNVVATFMLCGTNINDNVQAVIKRQISLGCEIANHSFNHLHMPELDADKMKQEIESTQQLVFNYTGAYPKIFRPPFIDVNKLMFDTIDLCFVCGVGSNDWDSKVTAEQSSETILNNVKDGDIILLHDFEQNAKTAHSLDTIIPALQSRGYEFVTVSKLFEINNVSPKRGVIYSNVND